ncbi:hypothetical protein HME9302_01100 [Alteripontixanthobacter maritimus]|uniref:Uncharacterized protein n=1 Tax=Alteripontixanthobacter maritimus TaxID=2161824 RepID=A0A369Q4S8_9SPHN|nr:hypothetical protein HME9302_01100 [Alteripontixanthobacter maritimus]
MLDKVDPEKIAQLMASTVMALAGYAVGTIAMQISDVLF